jgi:hypothetical protein
MTQWPAENSIKVKVADLAMNQHNSRTHSAEQIEKLANAINEWGWTVPILIDEAKNVIAGHGRVMAAEKLGIDEVPCVTAVGWTEEKKRAYLIADNRIAEMSDWNMDALIEEAQFLMDGGFDLDLVGIDDIFLGGTAEEFKPVLDPTSNHKVITDDDVEKVQGKLDAQTEKPEKRTLITVICPHCAEDFEVEGY